MLVYLQIYFHVCFCLCSIRHKLREKTHKFKHSHTFHTIYQINLISKVQQNFGVFADVVDVVHSLLFINFDVVVDDKCVEGSNVVATDNCWDDDGVDIDANLLCILYTNFTV